MYVTNRFGLSIKIKSFFKLYLTLTIMSFQTVFYIIDKLNKYFYNKTSSQQYVTYINHNTKRIQKSLKVASSKCQLYIQLKSHQRCQLKLHSVIKVR